MNTETVPKYINNVKDNRSRKSTSFAFFIYCMSFLLFDICRNFEIQVEICKLMCYISRAAVTARLPGEYIHEIEVV